MPDTPDSNLDVRHATDEDLDSVVVIIVSAFYDDPTWSWAFPDPSRRAGQQAWLWGLSVRGALRYPWVWTAAGNGTASVWIPPEGTELSDEQEAMVEPTLRHMMGADAERPLTALGMLDAAHPHDEPHFYLSLLGTHVDKRGHGYGLQLLGQNLHEIDETQMPAYLEASNPANVPLYQRHGFAVRDSLQLPDGGPEVFTMWREPQKV